MQRARYGAILAASCALAMSIIGCGPPCSAQGGCHQRASADDIVCFHEAPTGSHIAETRCFKRSELEERSKADRAVLENAQINSNRPSNGKRVP